MTRDELIETMARAAAYTAAGKLAIRRDGESLTIARMCGYGWEGDGGDLTKFTDKNWPKFKEEIEAALTALESSGLAIVPVDPRANVPFVQYLFDDGRLSLDDWTTMLSKGRI